MWIRIEGALDRLHRRAVDRDRPGRVRALRALIFTQRLARRLVGDEALRTAAALSFTTLLAMVPLLAVSFAILKVFVTDSVMAAKVRGWLLGTLLADSVGKVTEVIESLLLRAEGGSVGLVGFIFLLVTSVSLFLSIERAFNRIWHVPPSRPLHRRLTTFYSVITLAPALVGLGFVAARQMQSGLASLPFGVVIGAWLVEFLPLAFALLMLYRLLPHAPVEWRTALVGASLAAIMFQLSKWGFNTYVITIYNGSVSAQLYGSFALIPLFFLWVYLTWIIVLGGVEVTYIIQNHGTLTRDVLDRRARGGEPAPPTGYLIARTFFEVAQHFRHHGGGLSAARVSGRLQIDIEEVHGAVRRLHTGGLLLKVEGADEPELVPARPLDHVLLSELYALGLVDGYRPGQIAAAGAEALEAHLMSVSEGAAVHLSRPVADFVDAEEAPEAPSGDAPP